MGVSKVLENVFQNLFNNSYEFMRYISINDTIKDFFRSFKTFIDLGVDSKYYFAMLNDYEGYMKKFIQLI